MRKEKLEMYNVEERDCRVVRGILIRQVVEICIEPIGTSHVTTTCAISSTLYTF